MLDSTDVVPSAAQPEQTFFCVNYVLDNRDSDTFFLAGQFELDDSNSHKPYF